MSSLTQINFSLNLRWMKMIGLYPPETPTTSFTFLSYVLYLFSVTPTAVLGILKFVLIGGVKSLDYNALAIVAMVVYIPKFLPFLTNATEIKECINFFDSTIFTLVEDVENTMAECTRVCRRNTNVFFRAGIMCWVILTTKQFWIYELPVEVWLPFSVADKPVWYGCMFVVVAIGVGYVTLACGTVDPLIWGLACNITAQLRILKYNLQHLDVYEDKQMDLFLERGLLEEKNMQQKLKICILHHEAICSFVGQYEVCFSQVIFSQLSGSIFLIGLGCLQLSADSLFSANSITMMVYMSFILFQIYCFCYYGTTLYEENHFLSTSVYMGRWYNYDVTTKKGLILLLERSKRPMIVTVGGLLELSLDTFTTIIKRSYSLLALLRTYK